MHLLRTTPLEQLLLHIDTFSHLSTILSCSAQFSTLGTLCTHQNFIVLFPYLIKYYHIMIIIIVFSLGSDRPSGHHTNASLLTFFFCFFILFHPWCFHARVFGKILVHEFHISNSHTECYLIFFEQRNHKCTSDVRDEISFLADDSVIFFIIIIISGWC